MRRARRIVGIAIAILIVLVLVIPLLIPINQFRGTVATAVEQYQPPRCRRGVEGLYNGP